LIRNLLFIGVIGTVLAILENAPEDALTGETFDFVFIYGTTRL